MRCHFALWLMILFNVVAIVLPLLAGGGSCCALLLEGGFAGTLRHRPRFDDPAFTLNPKAGTAVQQCSIIRPHFWVCPHHHASSREARRRGIRHHDCHYHYLPVRPASGSASLACRHLSRSLFFSAILWRKIIASDGSFSHFRGRHVAGVVGQSGPSDRCHTKLLGSSFRRRKRKLRQGHGVRCRQGPRHHPHQPTCRHTRYYCCAIAVAAGATVVEPIGSPARDFSDC